MTGHSLQPLSLCLPARDGLDYVTAWSGVIAAALAAVAIMYAAWQNAQTRREAVRERRIEFELSLLAEIRKQMSISQFQHLHGYVSALVRDQANEGELAVLRAHIGARSGPLGRFQRGLLVERLKAAGKDVEAGVLKVASREVDDAISRRVRK